MTNTYRKLSDIIATIKEDVIIGELTNNMASGRRGAVIGALNRYSGCDENRHAILKFLFGKESSKGLSEGEWYALYTWIGFWHDEEVMAWAVADRFPAECEMVLVAALEARTQPTGLAAEKKNTGSPAPAPVVRAYVIGGRGRARVIQRHGGVF